MGKEATVVVKRLAGDLATKRNENYSQVVGWMRCSPAFSLARSAIRCVRGSRSTHRRDIRQSPMDLIHAETRFECEYTVHVYPNSHSHKLYIYKYLLIFSLCNMQIRSTE